jgi:hypothetical protein
MVYHPQLAFIPIYTLAIAPDALVEKSRFFDFLTSPFSVHFYSPSFIFGHLVVLFYTTKRQISSVLAFLNFEFGHGQNRQNDPFNTSLPPVYIVTFQID